MTKERLDKILIEKGFFGTKNKAQAAIMAGDVKVDGIVYTKAGQLIELKETTAFEIKQMPFVSRGGFKLDKAIKTFNINLNNRICLDAGASTGGFTDCMIQNGAKKVYAVDVGYGQIAWKLRTDEKVKVIERINIKNCLESDIYNEDDEKADFLTMDLSFISITKVMPNLILLANQNYFEIVSLIKPQFEAGREQVGKNGIVKDKETHIEVIQNIVNYSESLNLKIKGITFSPVKGAKGNIEYLIYLASAGESNKQDITEIVNMAHDLT